MSKSNYKYYITEYILEYTVVLENILFAFYQEPISVFFWKTILFYFFLPQTSSQLIRIELASLFSICIRQSVNKLYRWSGLWDTFALSKCIQKCRGRGLILIILTFCHICSSSFSFSFEIYQFILCFPYFRGKSLSFTPLSLSFSAVWELGEVFMQPQAI